MAKKPTNMLDETLHSCKGAFLYVLLFSLAANLLMMALPLYTLQVLDRVISSGSIETLVMLSLVMLGAFIALGLVQVTRSLALIKIGEWIDKKLAPEFLYNSVSISALSNTPSGSQSLRDLNTLRQFLTGQAINSLFDAPWAIIYIAVIFAIHPVNGMLTLAGGIVLFLFALFNEYATKDPLNEANELSVKSLGYVDMATRNAEVVEAMGMMPAISKKWHSISKDVIKKQSLASNRASVVASISRTIRFTLQIAVVGIGAYLVLQGQLSLGSIIASSILLGRALAPFEAAIETWKHVLSARKAHERMKKVLELPCKRNEAMSLPAPEGRLSAEKVVYAPPGSQKATIKGINFELNAGDILAVIGPSAAGKSTLAKLMIGVWQPASGNMRLDGADIFSWNRDEFGKYAGYLPQDVELFQGSVKENIARMQEDASAEDIVEAAKMAHVHDMILKLPNGYETQIGVGGSVLSAGQRQRVGLARAFFGNPKLVVLDEPNANLDDVGEHALLQTLSSARAKKITTIVISHRASILQGVDKILLINDGLVGAFGPRQDVLAHLAQQAQKAQQAATPHLAVKN